MEETIPTDLSLIYTNTTYPEPEEHNSFYCKTPSYAIFIIVCFFTHICVCGLVGNVVIMWVLGFCMKQNPFTIYVLNLAITDFSLLLTLGARFILYIISWVYCFDYEDFNLGNAILLPLFLVFYLAGMYLLTATSMEQCLAALFPVWYRCHRSKHFSGILCGVLGVLPALFLLQLILTCAFTASCAEVFRVLNIVNIALFSSLPLLSNLVLFIILRCGSQRRHPGKLYVAVLLSVLFLVVFWFPFTVEIFVYYFHRRPLYFSFLLAALNSSINPVIYFLVGSYSQCRFQCSIQVAFRRLFEEEATSEERSQVPEDAVMETSI